MEATEDVLAMRLRAADATREVIAGVRPEQFGAPTPCPDWDVRGLLDHMVGFCRRMAAGVGGTEAPTDPSRGDDPIAAFGAASRELDAAWRGEGVLERTFTLPWGEMPGSLLARMATVELLVHGWDIATATGQDRALDPVACEAALAYGRAMMRPEFRQRGGFGPEVAPPAGASPADRLAAFSGRRP